MDGMKNISKAEVLTLRGQVAYHAGQVVSRTLAQVLNICCTRARASSCPRTTRTRCTVRSSSGCCWSSFSESRSLIEEIDGEFCFKAKFSIFLS